MKRIFAYMKYIIVIECQQAHHLILLLFSLSWTPSFLLKRFILSGIRDGPQEPFIADSIDFVVGQVYDALLVS